MTLLLWLVDPKGLYERQWIYTLLALGGVSELYEIQGTSVLDGCPIVIFNHSIDYLAVFREYEKEQKPFIAIHLSDETLTDDFTFYTFSMCRHVFRNYYHPIASKMTHITTFGLGYQHGFSTLATRIAPEAERFYHWCFAGNIHSIKRLDFLRHFFDITPYAWDATMDGFQSPGGLKLEDYKRMLLQSKFALCPPGHGNVDTFRLYEAMEAGCIPVTYSHTAAQPEYWKKIFTWLDEGTTVPFIVADTPAKMRLLMWDVLQDANKYVAMLTNVREFWQTAKRHWGERFKAVLSLCNA